MDKGKVIHRSSVWPMEEAEINDDSDRERRENFTSKLKEGLGSRMEGLPIADDEEPDVKKDYLTPSFESYEDDTSILKRVPEPDDHSTDAYGKLISACITLPVSGVNQQGQVKQHNHDLDGNNIGKHHPDMSLNTTMYEVQFDDGHTESYAAKIIAESIYEQLDDEGNKLSILKRLLNISEIIWQFLKKQAHSHSKENHTRTRQQEDGFFVSCGKMVQPHGNHSRI